MSKKTQKSKIRPEAENPFPRVPGGSWAGITEAIWREIHGDFKQKNPGFAQSRHHRFTGLPGMGHYDGMWEEIKTIKSQIETSVAPGRQDFRDFLQQIVDKTTGCIDSAVALGIGPFETRLNTDREAFKHQVAMFLVLCQMLEKKQGNKIQKVFQEPRFKAAEIYVLAGLAGSKVVQHPDALQYMTDTSFVFSPHLTWPAFGATILKTLPSLYIGNRIQETISGVGQILAESYIEQVYTLNMRELGPEQLDIIRRADHFDSFYGRHEFSRIHDRLYPHAGLLCFENLWVHIPRRAHPGPVSPGSSSAATGPSNPGPNNRSDDGSNDGPRAPKVDSSTLSNTATPSVINTPAIAKFGLATIESVGTEPSLSTSKHQDSKHSKGTAPPQNTPATSAFGLSQISSVDIEPLAQAPLAQAPLAQAQTAKTPATQSVNPAPNTDSGSISWQALAAGNRLEDRSRQYRYVGPRQQGQNRGGFDQRGLPNRNRTDKIKDRYVPQKE